VVEGASAAKTETAAAAAAAQANAAVAAEAQLQKFDSSRVVDASTLPKADEAVMAALGSIRPGTDVYGYSVVAVYGVYLGAVPVVLQDKSGDRFQVDVCAKDGGFGAPRAVAHAKGFSFFLANGGDGRLASHEAHGLGAMALAQFLDRQGASGSVTGLLSLRERNQTYPNGAYTISV
jgi:hypothetical protein